eukprot:15455177-Alexandrium_andersonii.AAC.1
MPTDPRLDPSASVIVEHRLEAAGEGVGDRRGDRPGEAIEVHQLGNGWQVRGGAVGRNLGPTTVERGRPSGAR